MRRRSPWVVVAAIVCLAIGCGGESLPTSACANAFEGVVAGTNDQNLGDAFVECDSREDFISAAEEHPDALDGDARRFLDLACNVGDESDLPPACG